MTSSACPFWAAICNAEQPPESRTRRLTPRRTHSDIYRHDGESLSNLKYHQNARFVDYEMKPTLFQLIVAHVWVCWHTDDLSVCVCVCVLISFCCLEGKSVQMSVTVVTSPAPAAISSAEETQTGRGHMIADIRSSKFLSVCKSSSSSFCPQHFCNS